MTETTRIILSAAAILVFLAGFVAYAYHRYLKDWRRDITPGQWVRFRVVRPWWMDDDWAAGKVVEVHGDLLTIECDGKNYKVHRKEVRP